MGFGLLLFGFITNTAINIWYKFLCGHMSLLLGKYLGAEFLCNTVTIFNIQGTAKLFSEVAAPLYISVL